MATAKVDEMLILNLYSLLGDYYGARGFKPIERSIAVQKLLPKVEAVVGSACKRTQSQSLTNAAKLLIKQKQEYRKHQEKNSVNAAA